ncbi:MAG: CpsB/CapC family capsule biosynthesis tyrosine phosphatase [Gemmatimonadales bacterium]
MIDLHTHLIPGVDDGSHTVEQSVEVLRKFARQGVTAVCCTPHLKASEADDSPCEEMDAILGDLVDAAPPVPSLHRGFEIMLDVPHPKLADRCLCLAGSRYVLVEFGRLVPAGASVEILHRVAEQGLIPVLAHPERYAVCTPELAARWREAGAALQVDATTLLAESRRAGRARALVQAGCASIVASDNHGDSRSVAAAAEWLSSHGGAAQAQLLAVDNPNSILHDLPLADVPPLRIRRSLYTQLKEFLVGGAEA